MAQQGSIYLHDGTWYLKYRIVTVPFMAESLMAEC
jgi:hypothetical protein